MTRSSNDAACAQFSERLLELLWSLWAELGVSGWSRRHQEWAIDPEPLILVTAEVGHQDPRLRDESIQWCVRNSRYIANSRLRNLLRASPYVSRERWGTYAATVNKLGGATWPGATDPLILTAPGKTPQEDFKRPALVSLRLRTTLGVSARSEILLYFVGHPRARATAGELSDVVRYSKRNVEKELEALRKAGMLDVERRRNSLEHFVTQPESLLLFAGPLPKYFPRWDAIFQVLTGLQDFAERTATATATLRAIEGRRLLRLVGAAARDAKLPSPPEPARDRGAANLRQWGSILVEALALNDPNQLGWSPTTSITSQEKQQERFEGARTVVSPILANATDLEIWADTRLAQERMPELVRRLIFATGKGIVRVDMTAGESIHYGGYDGIVEVETANPFIPAGRSVWEIGVTKDVKGKADRDFAKRTEEPQGVDPSRTTFVFVTPRRWASKRVWERRRKSEGLWQDVRVLDADDLEAWLALAPSVHTWLSTTLGKSRGSIQDLQSYWADWSHATDPALSASLVLAGRQEAADELRKRVLESPSLIRVQADSTDEALAFIAAALQETEHPEVLLARSLVVHDPDAWNWAVSTNTPAILLPRFEDPYTVAALRRGHFVLVPVGREDARPEDLVVPRIRRDAAKSALIELGVNESRVENLATLARASLTSLRRRLALDPGLERPTWAHRVEAPVLIPALLAGAWDGAKSGDQQVLSLLADRSYADFERSIVQWAVASDPPIRKVGTKWFLVSKEDAWSLLAPQLTPIDITRYREALIRALGIPDPALLLPANKQWMANALGYEHPLSGHLRESLVDTLAIMGARGQEMIFLTGHTGEHHADALVREILALANGKEDGSLWASLSGVLPLLAEAAPRRFVDAVDTALARRPSPITSLFADRDQDLFASSPHTGLLWALENLAWSPEFMPAAARQLAALSAIDPGGKLANRPANSLRGVLLTWNPQTSASLKIRLDVLDTIRQKEPQVAWDLMLAILPKSYDVSTPSHPPRWRDWKEPAAERVTIEEYVEAVRQVTTRLLHDARRCGLRWADLVSQISTLPWDDVLVGLEAAQPQAFDDADRAMLWSALRSEISKHRQFADAEWALPSNVVDRLQHIYEALSPIDPIERYGWLFSQRPELPTPEVRDWAGQQAVLDKARASAVRELRAAGGVRLLRKFAETVNQPWEVGRVMGRTADASDTVEQEATLSLLEGSEKSDLLLARGYVEGRFSVKEWNWASALIETRGSTWTPARRAGFLSSLPFGNRTWSIVERFGSETEGAYWSAVSVGWLDDPEPSVIEYAATHLLDHERADTAVDFLALAIHPTGRDISPDLVLSALWRLRQRGTPAQWSRLTYDVTSLLEYLEQSPHIDKHQLAQLEWAYLPFLERTRRPPKVLHAELATNAQFFFEVLSMVFRAENEEVHEHDEEEQARAMLGYRLLDSWRTPPGKRQDGTVSEEDLNAWIITARTLAVAGDRERIADQQIGRILRWLPDDADGMWPNRVVRDLVERIESRDIETGLEIGLRNSRGVTVRDPTEGGAQERSLQTRYLTYARQMNSQWPRTAAMLRRIASAYGEEARIHDEAAEITEDRWRS